MSTYFNNSFGAAFSDELQKKLEENLPPHLKFVHFVAVPLCEN